MPKGGKREGAGRPRGSRSRRTEHSIAKAEALGPTPLEVLLESMHACLGTARKGSNAESCNRVIPKNYSVLSRLADQSIDGSLCDPAPSHCIPAVSAR